MESMDNQEFDRKLKAKVEHFEAPVPLGLWVEIEQELDAVEQTRSAVQGHAGSGVSLPKSTTSFRKLKRAVFIYGSMAAMLFIAFLFWKSTSTSVIYLESNQELAIGEPEIKAAEQTESRQVLLEDTSNRSERLPAPVQKTRSVSTNLPAKAGYANIKDVEIPAVLESTEEKALTGQGAQLESELAFVPTGRTVEWEEVREGRKEDLEPASQESIKDGGEEQSLVYAEVKSPKSKKIGVSTVLNFLAKGFSGEEGNSIEFSENEEGILQWDIKSSFAKNPK